MPIYHPYNRFYGTVTFNGETLMNDRLWITQISTGVREALKVTGANALVNSILWEDFFANPGWGGPTVNGDAMLGDRRRSFRPGEVLVPDWQVLTGAGDNVAVNAGGVQIGHGTGVVQHYSGIGAPGAAHPVTTGIPANGTFYYRQDGGALTTIYQVRAGAWVGVL